MAIVQVEKPSPELANWLRANFEKVEYGKQYREPGKPPTILEENLDVFTDGAGADRIHAYIVANKPQLKGYTTNPNAHIVFKELLSDWTFNPKRTVNHQYYLIRWDKWESAEPEGTVEEMLEKLPQEELEAIVGFNSGGYSYPIFFEKADWPDSAPNGLRYWVAAEYQLENMRKEKTAEIEQEKALTGKWYAVAFTQDQTGWDAGALYLKEVVAGPLASMGEAQKVAEKAEQRRYRNRDYNYRAVARAAESWEAATRGEFIDE